VIYPEDAAIARQLYANGKRPTDIHSYTVHVAYDLLEAAEEAADVAGETDEDQAIWEAYHDGPEPYEPSPYDGTYSEE